MSDRDALILVLLVLLVGSALSGFVSWKRDLEPFNEFTHPSHLPYGCYPDRGHYRLNWDTHWNQLVCEKVPND